MVINVTAGAYIWNFENTDIYFGTNGTKRASFLAGGGLAFNNDNRTSQRTR